LQVTSNFSFLRGASHPDELAEQAAALGLAAIAITDRNTLAGVVRAHVAAKAAGTRLVVGSRLELSIGERFTTERTEFHRVRDTDAERGSEAGYRTGVLATDEHRWTQILRKGALDSEERKIQRASRQDAKSQRGSEQKESGRLSDSEHLSSHSVKLSELCGSSSESVSEHMSSTSAASAMSSASSDSLSVLVYPTDRAAYGRLCRLLTRGKRRAPKGECRLSIHDLVEMQEGLLAVVVAPEASPGIAGPITARFVEAIEGLRRVFDGDRLSLAMSRLYGEGDEARIDQLAALSAHTGVPLVATNDVHYHVAERRALQDVVTCIRHGTTIDRAGSRLFPNGERYLKEPEEMARLFATHPDAIARTLEIAARAAFNLDELRYQYPDEVCPTGMSADAYLRELTYRGARDRFGQSNAEAAEGKLTTEYTEFHRVRNWATDEHRWTQIQREEFSSSEGEIRRRASRQDAKSQRDSEKNESESCSESMSSHSVQLCELSGSTSGSEHLSSSSAASATPSAASALLRSLPSSVVERIEHELALIAELGYATYFLTVYDIVAFARSQGILCQGRGAAANSAVCYCLGVTSVDPERVDMLFERFVSRERDEPPDIDVDFEHERREEVIQHIYERYGRDRAALTAEVISYRGRSAVREVGKALGLSLDAVDRLAKQLDWWDKGVIKPERVRELGLDPDDPTVRMTLHLTDEILGFPRHLSQHVGGFVITKGLLEEMVPIENAAMEDRTVIEWDKDDIDAMGMLKVDCLGLGMLTCIRKAFAFVNGSDEATERRSDEGVGDTESEVWRDDEKGEDVSGSGCVAEGDGSGEVDLWGDEGHAGGRTIRTDDADSAVGGLSAFEHRGGSWPLEPRRLSQTSSTRPGLTGGVGYSARAGREPEDALSQRNALRTHPRNGQSAAGSHPSSRTEKGLISEPLRRSVASSLRRYELHTIPPEDPLVYDMICAADTVGVFQIESRAQMSMLPRLRPRCYYDLVIEVAIVRPGPIQGKMVHPYLRRRCREEPVTYPSPEVKGVLERTLGVPLFQEQAMQLAVVAAGFTPGEADQLRRAMATWKRKGDSIGAFEDKFIGGMLARGYEREFADRCFEQIRGFGLYGFPESHAASFALLVYVSAWLKCHHPAAFAAALINSQPMGFYAPAQIVRDAIEHGVEVRGVDVNWSGWDCRLEEGSRSNAETAEGYAESAEGGSCSEEIQRRISRQDAKTQRGSELKEQILAESEHSSFNSASSASSSATSALLRCPALRLGMRLVRGLSEEHGRAIEEAVLRHGPFRTVEGLWRASGVPAKALRALASADAFGSMGLDRRRALWEVRGLRDERLELFEVGFNAEVAEGGAEIAEEELGSEAEVQRRASRQDAKSPRGSDQNKSELLSDSEHMSSFSASSASTSATSALLRSGGSEEEVRLPPMRPDMAVAHDYATVGLSLKAHPMSFYRETLATRGVLEAGRLRDERACPHGTRVSVAGVVLMRQRPGTASGIVFMTLEDETGIANLIIRPRVYTRYRKAARHGVCLIAHGHVERQGEVVHVVVRSVEDMGAGLRTTTRDFH
jgi:DNA polymerase III alpha subunit